MKSKSNLLEMLDQLPYFEKHTVRQLAGQFGLSESAVDTYISRYLRDRDVHRLKNGLYVSRTFYTAHKDDLSYHFYIANILRTPSYVSSWAALQYYDLTTEAVRVVTCVTSKVTREYETSVGTFAYQSIDKTLFSEYSLKKGAFDFYIASPAKALFDLLYFRTRQLRGVGVDAAKRLIEELRIDLDEMEDGEREKLLTMIANKYE